jgi:hypothetical protein
VLVRSVSGIGGLKAKALCSQCNSEKQNDAKGADWIEAGRTAVQGSLQQRLVRPVTSVVTWSSASAEMEKSRRGLGPFWGRRKEGSILIR